MWQLSLLLKDPMFSEGQITFGIIFFIIFCAIISVIYLRDKNLHQKNYKGVKWVLIGFIAFILLLIVIKFTLKE